MNSAVYTITPADAVRFFPEAAPLNWFISYSIPLLAGFLDSTPACLIGLCPPTLTSDTAYIWGYNTDLMLAHPLIYTRWSRRLIARALTCYPNIIGHCTRCKWKWLRSLGAELADVDGDIFTFQIKALP